MGQAGIGLTIRPPRHKGRDRRCNGPTDLVRGGGEDAHIDASASERVFEEGGKLGQML